ncbi:MAG: aldo/keto reductase [Pseudomonadota bacterium]
MARSARGLSLVIDDAVFEIPHPLRLGFGASGAWGQPWFPEAQAIALIEQAYAGGVRYFDSAGFYAGGEAEQRLGIALRGIDDVVISTKTGTQGAGRKAKKDFSAEAIRRDLEASLTRLGRDRLDILFLHGPDDWVVDHTRPVFDALKAEGLIAKAGVCGTGPAIRAAVAGRKTDAIMARFNLFDRALGPVFAEAKEATMTTIAIAPLGQALYAKGFLTPRTRTGLWALARALVRNPRQLWRQRQASAQMLNRVDGFTAAQLMLGYVLSQSSIDYALTSTTQSVHLTETLQLARANGLDTALLDSLTTMAHDTEGAGTAGGS